MQLRGRLAKKQATPILKLLVVGTLIALMTINAPTPAKGHILQQELNQKLYLPLVMKEFRWLGAWIEGKVVDARDQDNNGLPDPLGGVKVCTQYQECATTASDGSYTISLDFIAERQVTAEKEGYISLTQSVYPIANQTVTLNFVLSPPLQDVVSRVVLTWDATRSFTLPNFPNPIDNDLDAYLFIKHQTGNLMLYYDNRGNATDFPHALLLYDYREGAGPETIDITALESGEPPTEYHYAVHNANFTYSAGQIPSLAELKATVCVYFKEQSSANCYAAPAGEGQLWYLFSMTQEGDVTLKNCLLSLDPPDLNGEPPQCPPSP
ncbi:MAG: hypothetical protein ANABAC_3484 [Anaerolineae bacterium]|jgi:hypothetical protein|nr:MAG: hypothetical protein ANABAC_3484 [Anaerolineae bacterium]